MQNGNALLIEVTLDKERHLKYDFNALIALKKETGVNLLAAQKKPLDLRDPELLRALVWAGLLHEDPDLTLQFVGALLDVAGAVKFGAAIEAAVVGAMPEAVSQEAGNAPKPNREARRSVGKTSGK